MTHLDKCERELYTKVFLGVDTNGDGYVNKEELTNLCSCLGYRLTPVRIQALFCGLDKDRNCKITLDEFLAAMPEIEPRERKAANLRKLFLALDKNKDGFLTVAELSGAIKCGGVPISEKEINALIFQVDHNEDGKINYEEFIDLVQNFL